MTLKLKTIDFDVKNKAVNLTRYGLPAYFILLYFILYKINIIIRHVHSEADIFYVASELLKSEMPIELRTLGVKITDLQALSPLALDSETTAI